MRQRNIIGMLIMTAMALFGSPKAQAQEVSKEIKTEAFDAICAETVGTIHFIQAEKPSVKITGKEKFVELNDIYVKDNCLYIKIRKSTNIKRTKEGVNIYITAPTLRKINVSGVGEFHCKEPLSCDKMECKLEGVGEINISDLKCNELDVVIRGVGEGDIHVDCRKLKASVEGIGSLTLSGTAEETEISKDGIGSVNTKHLKRSK